MAEASIKKLSFRQLNTAMRLNVLTGGLATVWQIVCSPQPIFNVFLQNELGASSSTLGALIALIQLSGLFQLASIFIYGYAPRKKPFFVGIHLVHRILTLSIAASAFMAAAHGDRAWGIRAIMIALPISWIFMNASAAGWWSWVADIFPENIRGTFFLKRSAILNVINVIWFFLASMTLDLFDGPGRFWVYVVIFSIGGLTGLADIILNIFIPEPEALEKKRFSPIDALEPLKNSNFIRFSLAVGIAIFSINLIAPFQAPYVVNPDTVGAPNTWLGIMFVISQLTWVLSAPFWGIVMDKWGRKPVVVMGCFFVISWIGYLFLTHRSFTYLLPLISIGTGLLAPAFWEGINQMMLSLSPNRNRIAFVAWYMTIVGIVSAGGSLVGGFLLDALSRVSVPVGNLRFSNFHVVQLLAIGMVIFSALILSRVREGRERPMGFVIGRLANPGILKTYAYLDDIATASDPSRAEQALRSIESETGDLALEEILARLEDPYPEIREEAVRALGRIGSPLAVEALTERVGDRSSSLRIAAVRALGKIRDKRPVPVLIKALQETDSEEMLEACVQALGDIGGSEAEKAVLDFYHQTKSDRLRAAAADAAGRLGLFEAARDIFPRLLSGRSLSIRRQYAIAFGNLLGRPGEFYRYVSGSEAGMADRVGKVFKRLEAKARRIKDRAPKDRIKQNLALVLSARENFESGREIQALEDLVRYADSSLLAIFGEQKEEELQNLAFRASPHLGAFVWLLQQTKAYLATARGTSGHPDVYRLLTLLILYFLGAP
jgi:MFS family permease